MSAGRELNPGPIRSEAGLPTSSTQCSLNIFKRNRIGMLQSTGMT